MALAAPIAEFVVSLGTDGRIKSQGTLSSALEKDAKLAAYAAKERSRIKKAEETIDEPKPETAEQKATGITGSDGLSAHATCYIVKLGGCTEQEDAETGETASRRRLGILHTHRALKGRIRRRGALAVQVAHLGDQHQTVEHRHPKQRHKAHRPNSAATVWAVRARTNISLLNQPVLMIPRHRPLYY